MDSSCPGSERAQLRAGSRAPRAFRSARGGRAERLTTTLVHLLRHAKAGNRQRWIGPDALRPLTKPGRRQAEALVRSLHGPFSHLVSSPYVRCVQTLEPLARAHGLTLETADELREGAPAVRALELALALARDGSTVLCTHGDVMTFAVHELHAAGVPLEGPLEFRKGAAWVLEVGADGFERGHYVPPSPKGAALH